HRHELPKGHSVIEETVGQHSGWRTLATRGFALTAVALDVAWPYLQSHLELRHFDRPILLLTCLLAVLCLNDGDVPALGFRLAPVQGWGYWFRMGLWFMLPIAVLILICATIWWWFGWTIPMIQTEPSFQALYSFCVRAPVYEELIYRSLLFVAVAPSLGGLGTILMSGLVFASIHIIGGNPGPDNQIAGFMLAWAFLKSKTILVPIAMHSAGNLIALSVHIAGWYFG
ncbi:MAG: hypothetical protein JWN70_1498, partial [Planctomycetaceae bacterium]|nr:hypothetical protein [Planctomycetaceae bacterium]